jgi:hypothetical protein
MVLQQEMVYKPGVAAFAQPRLRKLTKLSCNTKLNFILGQSAMAEIQAKPLCRRLLVNTGWTNYKIQSE